MKIKNINAKSRKILSLILAVAILAASLPVLLGSVAAGVPSISDVEYPIGKVLWSFNAADVSDVPAGWESSTPVGCWGDGNTTLSYDSNQQAVKFYAGGTDGVLSIPSFEGDAENFIYEAVVTPSRNVSSFGLANNVILSSTKDKDGDGNFDAAGATWFAVYNNSSSEDGYYIRKTQSSIARTVIKGPSGYTRPALNQKHTIKLVVLNGYTYIYVNDNLMTVASDGAEGFQDSNTTDNISIGMFATNTDVYIHSITVREIAEPEEIKIWNGSFDGELPTQDLDGDGEIEIRTPEEFAAVMKTNGTFKRTINRVVNKTTEYRWWGTTINSTTDTVTVDEGFEAYIPYATEYTVKSSETTKEISREKFTASDGKEYDKATFEVTTTYTTTFRIKYELTGDIYLNDTTVAGWKDNNPNQWLAPVKHEDISEANTFYGIINGNGYVVRGVYVDATVDGIERAEFKDTQYGGNYDASILAEGSAPELELYEKVYAGLFPVIGEGAAIVAVGMEDSYICVRDSAAPITLAAGGSKDMNLVGSVGLIGTVAKSGILYATIDQCYINDSVILKGGRVAMVGYGNNTTNYIVSNCYASATITPFTGTKAKNAAGKEWDNNSGNRFMLVSGNGSYPTIYSCYTFGNVDNNGTFKKTTAAGKANNNVYYYSGWANGEYATSVDGNGIKGEGARSLMPNLDWTKFQTVTAGRPVLKVFTTHRIGTDGPVWNGGTDSDLATDADGYKLITNAAELRYAVVSSGNFRLAEDIWVNSMQVYTVGDFYLADGAPKTWVESGSFNGIFDGNGNVVRGLFYNASDVILVEGNNPSSGLLPTISGSSTVKKVGVDHSWMRNNGTGRMGAIVGTLDQSGGCTIDTCYAGENVMLQGFTKVGGITGGRDNGSPRTIKNCYSLATIKTSDGVYGGIAGDGWNTGKLIISNCYANVGSFVGNGGGVVGTNNYITGSDAGATQISASKMMGADALTNMPGLNTDNVYQTTIGYPMLKVFDENYVEEEEVGDVWNGSIAATFAGGTGTATDPYIISKGSQLAKAVNEFGLGGAYFKLDRDIYLNTAVGDSAHGWFEGITTENKYYSYKNKIIDKSKTTTMGIFSGHIDGDGHTIYGLNYRSGNASSSSGLIPFMAAGTIKNLGIDKSRIIAAGKAGEEGNSAGGFIGRTKQTGVILIDRCYAGKDVYVSAGGGASGFVGYAQGNSEANYIEISNSYSLATLSSSYKSCAFYGDVWETWYKLTNVFSNTIPINAGGTKQRASKFVQNDLSKIATTFVNVYAIDSVAASTDNYEFYDDGEGNITYTYTSLPDASMRGTQVFRNMTINGDDAFLYNIGYPTLKWQGNTVPAEEELISGLINIASAMPMTEFKIDTKVFIIRGNFASTSAPVINLVNGDDSASFKVAADGTVTIESSTGAKATKNITLGADNEYTIASIDGFLIAFVNGECVGLADLVSKAGYTATFSGFNLDNDSIIVDHYIGDANFNSVEFSDVNLQIADAYGKTVSGGAKLDITLKDESYLDDMGYPVEYGYLVYIGDKVVSDITADDAGVKAYEFNASTEPIEIIGLGTKGQELFFAFRGYAKITVNEDIEHYYYGDEEIIFSPIYEANKLYENEAYAEAIKAVYGASDKFIENNDGEIEFVTFGDYHYNDDQYTSQLSDLLAITATADTLNGGEGADFILSLGDMFNDGIGSKEVTNYLLNGTYSGKDGTTYNNHNYNFFNLYGNHELEASNRLTYVNTTLTNTDVHWGDGSVGSVAAVTQKYAGQSVGNNEFEKRNELATGSYYWFEKNGIRVIVTNTNFSWNPNHINGEVVGWEHNLIGSYGSPSAANNASRGFDEGAEAAGNSKTNSLGAVQLEWLESVLMDAVEQGTPCIVAGHSPMADAFGSGGDAKQVRALYKKANDIRKGTVLASFNGHQHTNRQTVVEDVLYLDITTVRNSEWRSVSEPHYSAEHTFTYDYYDNDGNWIKSETRQLNSLSMGKNTWFANDPVRSSVKITANGHVELTGMKTSYMYDVIPEGYKDYGYPGQNSGYWTLGDKSFTVTEYAYPAR